MKKLACLAVLGLLSIVFAAASASASDSNPGFDAVQKDVKSVGDITITVGSKALVVSWQGIEIGGNVSSWLREKLDGIDGSDPDGNISSDEADAAQTLLTAYVQQEFNQYSHDAALNNHLLIDTINPQDAKVTSLVAQGVEGPVESADGISLSFVAVVSFPTKSADVHTVKLDMGKYYFQAVNESQARELVGDFSLTIRAADGWTIDPSSIQPSCAADNLDSGVLVFTVDDVNCFTQRSGVVLGFSITGHDEKSPWDVPGFEGVGLLAALGLLGVALRRRL